MYPVSNAIFGAGKRIKAFETNVSHYSLSEYSCYNNNINTVRIHVDT